MPPSRSAPSPSDLRRVPVIVGVGQINDRSADDAEALDTLDLMVAALEAADRDAGGGFLGRVQSLGVVNQMSWDVVAWPNPEPITPYLVRALGIAPAIAHASEEPSGDSPVRLINDAANRIGSGELEIAAVVGAEALRTSARRAAAERARRTAVGQAEPPNAVRDYTESAARPFLKTYGLVTATDVYPLYESATRAAWGQTFAEAQAETGSIWAGMSAVAAENPHAWLRTAQSAEAITTASGDNRMIAFPYTKLMVANSSVNQGAALIMTSLAKALELGVAEARLIYVGPGAAAHEPDDFLARDDYVHSAAMEVSIEMALALNGLCAVDLDVVELYSCFPCVPKMARRALGWPLEKPHSVYGGLTFGGGPIANCMTHAAARIVERLRVEGRHGFIFANGGYAAHNHSIVLSRQPPPGDPFPQDYLFQAEADARRGPIPPLTEGYVGPGRLETYTVPCDRAGAPLYAAVVGRAPDGARFVCRVSRDDAATLDWLTSGVDEPVGTMGQAVADADGTVRWKPDRAAPVARQPERGSPPLTRSKTSGSPER